MKILIEQRKCQCGYFKLGENCHNEDCPRYQNLKKEYKDLYEIKKLCDKLGLKIYVK